MQIHENYSLLAHNTFGFKVYARYFVSVATVDELQVALLQANTLKIPHLLLGGGSNIVLVQHFPGIVIYVNFLGIDLIKETDDHFFLKVGAGENWHRLVKFCLAHQYYGLENLALIPGNVGAAPIQNIGAYGIELDSIVVEVEAMEIATGYIKKFNHSDCQFGYRTSIFKHQLNNQWVIMSVVIRLNKKPELNISYPALQQALANNKNAITPKHIFELVCQIRQTKLPDPKVIGNAGSFFKNPIVTLQQLEEIQLSYPNVVYFPLDETNVKLAAGWLIEQAGWKGYREKQVGVHEKQALVLVNYGHGKGGDILTLAKKIQQSIKQKFNIELAIEPHVFPEQCL